MDNIATIGIVTPSAKLVTHSTTQERPKFEKCKYTRNNEFSVKDNTTNPSLNQWQVQVYPYLLTSKLCQITKLYHTMLHTTAGDPQFSETEISH